MDHLLGSRLAAERCMYGVSFNRTERETEFTWKPQRRLEFGVWIYLHELPAKSKIASYIGFQQDPESHNIMFKMFRIQPIESKKW